MRRFFCCLLVSLLLAAPAVMAEDMPWDIILDAVDALRVEGLEQEAVFDQADTWMSVTVIQSGMIAPRLSGTQYIGLVFDLLTGETVTWDRFFSDGDEAAARMEAIAQDAVYDNAYAEYNQITPMPRDSFTVTCDILTVYYPATQLSHFSGRSGGFCFYAYELEGLLREDIPLKAGDVTQAVQALDKALTDGALPGPLAGWSLGGAMSEASEELGLVDVPDLTYDYAVYHFDAPYMRGISLLSLPEEDNADTAMIAGIYARRIDFSGLCTGIATIEECKAALGEPDSTSIVNEADMYCRLPEGITLGWIGEGRILEMHFVEDILHSVTLRVL